MPAGLRREIFMGAQGSAPVLPERRPKGNVVYALRVHSRDRVHGPGTGVEASFPVRVGNGTGAGTFVGRTKRRAIVTVSSERKGTSCDEVLLEMEVKPPRGRGPAIEWRHGRPFGRDDTLM